MEDQKKEEAWYEAHKNEINDCMFDGRYPYPCIPPRPIFSEPNWCDRFVRCDCMKNNENNKSSNLAFLGVLALLIGLGLSKKEEKENETMNDAKFECDYEDICYTRTNDPSKCSKCRNNKRRNYQKDCFVNADDEPIPEKHVDAKDYNSPINQTVGYECPICHGHTHPYQLSKEKICKHCGYKLFL